MTNTNIVTTPHLLSPVNNLWGNLYVLSNATYTATNFKYVTKLYVNGSYVIKELLPPRPTTGYGNYSGYVPIKTSLSYDLNPSITTFAYATNSIARYNINYGEEWNPDLQLESVFALVAGPATWWGFSFSTPHGLTAGDIINIQSQNPYYGGTQTVSAFSLSNNTFRTDRYFTSLSAVNTGYISDVYRDAGTSDTYWAYNGTRQYDEPTIDFSNIIFKTSSLITPRFITNYPNGLTNVNDLKNGKPILENSRETLSAFVYPGTYSLNVALYSPTFSFQSNASYTFNVTSAASMSRIDLPVGTYNLRNSSMGISFSNVGAYYVYLTGAGGYNWSGSPSQVRAYQINRNCYAYANVRLMFLNKWGAFDYQDFHLDDKKSYKINKTEYKQELAWNYSIGDRNRTILSQQVQEEHVVNSDWLNEDQYAWLNELLVSPEVYMIDEGTGYIYPIIVTDKNWEFKTAFRNQIFNLTLTYEMSYPLDVINQ